MLRAEVLGPLDRQEQRVLALTRPALSEMEGGSGSLNKPSGGLGHADFHEPQALHSQVF